MFQQGFLKIFLAGLFVFGANFQNFFFFGFYDFKILHIHKKKEDNLSSTSYLLRLYIRLLHPQHLDEIWIEQGQHRMPLAPLSEYPEPWF